MTEKQGTNNAGSTTKRLLAIGFGLAAAGTLTACGAIDIDFDVDGSGTSETVSYDLGSFDKVEVGSAFEVDIAIETGDPSVEITMDDNLFEHLEIEVDGDVLKVHMDDGFYDFSVDPEVVITMPSIEELDVSGATETKLIGLNEAKLSVNASGASDLTIEGSADELVIDTSGGSTLEIKGSAETVKIDSSGASNSELDGLTADLVTVDLSGASHMALGDVGEVTGSISGASNLEVKDDTSVSVETSGVSSVDRG